MTPPRGTKRAAQAKVDKASRAALEKALADERLALAAITKVFLLEVPDPERLLARLEAMCRGAEQNPRTPVKLRQSLLSAVLFVRTAIQRELGKPQSLLDPDVGHVRPERVDKLVDPAEGEQQLGLAVQGQGQLGDVQEAHEERVETIAAVHGELVNILRQFGPLTDIDLHQLYTRSRYFGDFPLQSAKAIVERRKELVGAGRVVRSGALRTVPQWDVVERDHIEAGAA